MKGGGATQDGRAGPHDGLGPFNTLRAACGNNRRVLGNFFYLSIVQFANYMAPLILIPYLTHVLGLSRYGLVELARAVSVYFLILTDYGFSLSATREVSVHRDDPERVSEVFSSVMLLKLLLVLLGGAILSAAVFAIPKLRADWPVYYLAFASVIGMWLFPMWLFQGLERMKPIAVLTVISKTFVIIATILIVRDTDDYLYVPLLHSSGVLLLGVTGLIIGLRRFPVQFRFPSVDTLRREFTNGWHLFISRLATTMYTTGNVVILGLLTDHVFVAYYAVGEKIVRAATDGLMIPLSQAIFPHIGRLASQSKQAAMRYAAGVAGVLSIITLAISAGLFLGAPYIARMVLAGDPQAGAAVIRILSPLPFIVGLGHILGVQIMVNIGLKRTFTRILTVAGVFDLILAVALARPLQHVGVSIAALLTEVFILLALLVSLKKHAVNIVPEVGGGGDG